MATRTQLLDAFEAKLEAEGSFFLPATGQDVMPDGKTYISQTFTSLDEEHEAEWHIVTYWDNTQGRGASAQFSVVDRGTAGEDARWPPGKNPRPDTSFGDGLRAWLNSAVADGTIEFYEVLATLPDAERAKVDVLITLAGDLVERTVGVRHIGGNWYYEVVKQ